MLGKPKFKKNQKVNFTINDKKITGKIVIIDAYGTFEQTEEVSYDVLSDDNVLYKHVRESWLNN